jgi:C-terminal processing protease CtpA/Prc
MFAALVSFLVAASEAEPRAFPVKLPPKDRTPIFREGLPATGEATPAPRKRFFGIGVGFQTRAGAQGIALDQVVAGSPADRAGLAAGTVIAEINGEATLGRSGEDCTRLVRESGNNVVLKFYDPATFKLRIRTLEKDWFFLPN